MAIAASPFDVSPTVDRAVTIRSADGAAGDLPGYESTALEGDVLLTSVPARPVGVEDLPENAGSTTTRRTR